MFGRLIRVFPVLALVLVPVIGAQAAVQQFTDPAAFEAAVGSVVVHDFDAFDLNEGRDVFGYYQTLDTQIPGLDFDNARLNLGGFGGTSNSSPNVVLNADFVNPIEVTFSTPQFAVGLFNSSLIDAERFEILDINDVVIGSIDLPSAVVNFGGFVSDTGIVKIRVTPISPTNGSIYIDDLTLAQVPLPAAAYLFIAALVGLFGTNRLAGKRRTQVRFSLHGN